MLKQRNDKMRFPSLRRGEGAGGQRNLSHWVAIQPGEELRRTSTRQLQSEERGRDGAANSSQSKRHDHETDWIWRHAEEENHGYLPDI